MLADQDDEEKDLIEFTKFMWYCAQGAVEKCREVLDRKELFLNRTDFDGRTPLHVACAEARLGVAEWLVQKGANIHMLDRWSRTAMDDAVACRDPSINDFMTKVQSEQRRACPLGDTPKLVTRRLGDSPPLNMSPLRTLSLDAPSLSQSPILGPRTLSLSSQGDLSNEIKVARRNEMKSPPSALRRATSWSRDAEVDVSDNDDDTVTDAERDLAIILETVSSPMIVIDSEGIILAANEPACSLTDYVQLDLVNNNVSILVDPVHRDKHDGYIRNYLATGQQRLLRQAARHVNVVRRDGTLVHALLSLSETKTGGQTLFVGNLIPARAHEAHDFFAAAASGDVSRLKEMLQHNYVSVNACDYDKQTALHIAASQDQYECLRVLLTNGADPNKLDCWNRTPLMNALGSRRTGQPRSACAQLLIRSGGFVFEDNQLMSWQMSTWCRGEECLSEIRPEDVQLVSATPVGQGSFGVVHLGRWRGRQIACKRLLIENMEPHELQTCVSEFAQEVNVMRKLKHPNIVQFYGAWLNNPPYLLITEYCENGSIISVLEARKGRPFKEEKVLRFTLNMAAGMSYLHSLKPPIIHRDLKPGNLLIDGQGSLKIADFGLAKVKPRLALTGNYEMTGETGSYRYMAPEVFRHDKDYNEKVDQYSFAIIVWELLEGQRYLDGTKAIDVAIATDHGARPLFNPSRKYPEGLPELLKACWAEDPAARPAFTDIVTFVQRIIDKKPLDKSCAAM